MNGRKLMAVFATLIFLGGTNSTAGGQTIDGSLADALGINGGGNAAGVLAGSAGVGIPLPSAALGIAPGEPVLLLNSDLNVVAIAGGAIEDATGGIIPSGSAQNVIQAGIDGDNVARVIENEAATIVARAVEEQSGGFVTAGAVRPVIAAAIAGDNIRDAIERAVFDRVVTEAGRLLAGQIGEAAQNATAGFLDPQTVEDLFTRAVQGRNLTGAFRDAFRRRVNSTQGNGTNNPVVITNATP